MWQIKLYLILTFRKTSIIICKNLSQHYTDFIRLKAFPIVFSSYTWFSIHKYLIKQNLMHCLGQTYSEKYSENVRLYLK